MVARQWDGGEDDLAIVCDGSAALDRLHDRIARRFRRAEVRARAALPERPPRPRRAQERLAVGGGDRRGGAAGRGAELGSPMGEKKGRVR